ncbi:MAG TPA: NAD(P)-dependent oxidoreductase [Geminicoccaceae bacterium]|nr:NAD(P)-dependent oxidoreductase [Geminicoccaceae bacterium]
MTDRQAVVVIAEFEVKPEFLEAFTAAARRHAENCLAREPGCRQFDLFVSRESPTRLGFYEVYADAEALAQHRATEHIRWFRDTVQPWILAREVRELTRVNEGAKPAPRSSRVLVALASLAERRHLLTPLEAAGFELTQNDLGRAFTEAELVARLPGHFATIAGSEPYNERVLAAAPGLKVIARLGVGHDQIDLAAATRHGVAVAMAFGTNHEPVADHAFALMAALAHRLPEYDRRVRGGGWGSLFHGRLHGTTAGIVGFGRIGRTLAKRCQGFAMQVLVCDPVMDADTVARLGCRLTSLEELLKESDFVSLHAPLTPRTVRMIDARRLALMKPGAFLVNTARGPLIDEAALADALREGRIAGAGLDVFEQEPCRDSPLLALDNVVLTPHVAGSSEWAMGSMAARCVASILDIARGEDPGSGLVLNPEVLAPR